MMVNIAYAVLSALKVAVKETRSAPGSLKGAAIEKVMQDLLHVSDLHTEILQPNLLIRIAFCWSSRPIHS